MFLIAGPCAIEGRDMLLKTADTLVNVCQRLGIQLYFKSSYDKANRTSDSARGIGMEKGLTLLQEVSTTFKVPIVTDVHESCQCAPVAEIADVLQIPAFLSRQTDLLQAAAQTGKTVNVKKGQFMAPWDMKGAIHKVEHATPAGEKVKLWLTERGSSFGYGNLVVDMRSLVVMRQYGYPVVFDATHSVQQPSGANGITDGNREMVPYLMRAAMAIGVDGLFLEVHPDPDKAISDAANQVKLDDISKILEEAVAFDALSHQFTL